MLERERAKKDFLKLFAKKEKHPECQIDPLSIFACHLGVFDPRRERTFSNPSVGKLGNIYVFSVETENTNIFFFIGANISVLSPGSGQENQPPFAPGKFQTAGEDLYFLTRGSIFRVFPNGSLSQVTQPPSFLSGGALFEKGVLEICPVSIGLVPKGSPKYSEVTEFISKIEKKLGGLSGLFVDASYFVWKDLSGNERRSDIFLIIDNDMIFKHRSSSNVFSGILVEDKLVSLVGNYGKYPAIAYFNLDEVLRFCNRTLSEKQEYHVIRGKKIEKSNRKEFDGVCQMEGFTEVKRSPAGKLKNGLIRGDAPKTPIGRQLSNRVSNFDIPVLFYDFPRRKYAEGGLPGAKENIHLGQLKLHLTEIEFLTKILKGRPGLKKFTIVYGGAAPSNHTPLLSEMFPEAYFELCDPAPFRIRETPKIKIHRGLLDLDLSKFGPEIYFISDIRTVPDVQTVENYDEEVRQNNVLQNNWVIQPNVMASMIKYRQAFDNKKSESPKGLAYIQPFARRQSTETRLISFFKDPPPEDPLVDKEIILIDNSEQEEKMAYLNQVVRQQTFFDKSQTFGGNYDLMRMAQIISEYLKLRGKPHDDGAIYDWIVATEKFLRLSQPVTVLAKI